MPVVFNLDKLESNTGTDTSESQLLTSLSQDGLIYIKTKRLRRHNRADIMTAARFFFEQLSDAEKRSVAMTGFTRGYIPVAGESGSLQVEVKEGFAYGYSGSPSPLLDSPLCNVNSWPEALPSEHRRVLQEFFTIASDICQALTEIIAKLLHRPELVELCKCGEQISLMRMFHYIAQQETGSTDENTIGSSAHTDWGFLTLIFQDQIGGLQYQSSGSGDWLDVPADDQDFAVVINCGDYLSLLTDGRLKSPVHRVLLPQSQDRFSLVYFFYPGYDSPLPKSLSHGQQYSLLQDQSHASNKGNIAGTHSVFGDYILSKWKQVHRRY